MNTNPHFSTIQHIFTVANQSKSGFLNYNEFIKALQLIKPTISMKEIENYYNDNVEKGSELIDLNKFVLIVNKYNLIA